MRRLSAIVVWLSTGAALAAQGTVSPDLLLRPTPDAWPMYNGDYSGRRFSPLTTIDRSTVPSMTLAWVYRPNPGNAPAISPGGSGNCRW